MLIGVNHDVTGGLTNDLFPSGHIDNNRESLPTFVYNYKYRPVDVHSITMPVATSHPIETVEGPCKGEGVMINASHTHTNYTIKIG